MNICLQIIKFRHSLISIFLVSLKLLVCPGIFFMVARLDIPQTRRESKDLKKTSRTDNGLHFSKIQVDFTANLSVPSAISQDS